MTTFNGTVASDFMKEVVVSDSQKVASIDYAATDFMTLRAALINYIQASYPLDYQNFSESDLGMMLIEVIAYMGAVTSLKADLLANESFIATAVNRFNVQKLLELVGIRLRGPTSAAANAQVTLNASSDAPFLTLRSDSRVVSVISPQDASPLSYTAYKTVAGKIENANDTGDITLYPSEAANATNPKVWQNVAYLEGALVVQTGTFGGLDIVKTIALEEGPVVEGSVQVFVNAPSDSVASGAFTQVESIYFASGATDKIFQVNLNDNFGGEVVFGDGIAAVAPPPGSVYTIFYRVGGGSRGNVQESFINAAITLYQGNLSASGTLGNLANTTLATGGADAETITHAKKYGPLFFKSQDRLVTLEDYVAHGNRYISSYSTVGKVTAAVRQAYSSANIIDVYVLEKASILQLQKASSAFKMGLLDYLNDKKMLTDEIVIVDGLIRTLDLVLTVKCDGELEPQEEVIKTKVRNILLTYFGVENRAFGEDLSISDLIKTIFKNVDEVRYTTIDNFVGDIIVDFNEIIQLNNFTINVVFL